MFKRIRFISLLVGLHLVTGFGAVTHAQQNIVASLERTDSGDITEGGPDNVAEFTVTLDRTLGADVESIEVPLLVTGDHIFDSDVSFRLKAGAGLNTAVSLEGSTGKTPRVRFRAGARVATLELLAADDITTEGDETLTLTLRKGLLLYTDINREDGVVNPHATQRSFSVVIKDNDTTSVVYSLDVAPTEVKAKALQDGDTVTLTLTPEGATFPGVKNTTGREPGALPNHDGQLSGGQLTDAAKALITLVDAPSGLAIDDVRLLARKQGVHGMPSNFYHRSAEIDLTWSGSAFSADDPVSVRVDRQLLRYLGRKDGGAKMGRWDDNFLLRTATHLSDDFTIKAVLNVTLTTPVATAREGADAAEVRLALSRALQAGEKLAVPLAFAGGTLGTDFTLALSGTPTPTGVSLSGNTVTFTGGATGSATTATILLSALPDADTDDETVMVTIPASSSGAAPTLGATGLIGGAAGQVTQGHGTITVTDGETITLSIPADADEGNSGYTDYVFGVTLSQALTGDEEIVFGLVFEPSNVATRRETEGASGDYDVRMIDDRNSLLPLQFGLLLGQSISASDGTAKNLLVVRVYGDTEIEPNEMVIVNLSLFGSPERFAAVRPSRAFTIVNDDELPTVTIAPTSEVAVTEGSGASFTVTAAPAPATGTTLTVNLNVADAEHADFWDEKGQGEQTVEISDTGAAIFTVDTEEDAIDEPSGAVTVTVTASAETPADYAVSSAKGTATVAVKDDDETGVTLTTPDRIAMEGSATDTASIVLTLGRALRSGESLLVPLAFDGGVLGTDFTLALSGTPTGVSLNATTGVVTFMGGDAGSAAAATLVLSALSDADAEDTEDKTVRVTIREKSTDGEAVLTATGLDGGAATGEADTGEGPIRSGVITITDVTPVVTIERTSLGIMDEGGNAVFRVSATPAPAAPLTVNLMVTDAPYADFVASGEQGRQMVTIPPSGSVSHVVNTQTDTTDEPSGPVTVEVAASTTDPADYVLGGDPAASVWVNDDDDTTLALEVTDATATEGDSSATATIQLRLNRGLSRARETLRVPLQFAGGVLADDFTLSLSGTPAGVSLVDGQVIFGGEVGDGRVLRQDPGITPVSVNVLLTALRDGNTTNETLTVSLGQLVAMGLDVTGSRVGDGQITVTDDGLTLSRITIAPTSTAAVTEGGAASFTVTATPPPTADLVVTLNVADSASADYIAAGDEGSDSVTIPSSGSVTYSVDTVDDDLDEVGGAAMVSVVASSDTPIAYAVGRRSEARIPVLDDDATVVTLTTPDRSAMEGSSSDTASIVLTLGRALQSGESLAVPLAFSGGKLDTDFVLSLASASPPFFNVALRGDTVTFTSKARQQDSSMAAEILLHALADTNTVDGSVTVSIPSSSTGAAPRLGATGLAGGAAGQVTRNHGNLRLIDNGGSARLVITPSSLTVDEGGSDTYTVRLATAPTADVTVAISGHASTDLTLSAASLRFTPPPATEGAPAPFLWSTPQTVTVTAAADGDAENDEVTLAHTASGGGYNAVSGNVAVTVDDTTPEITIERKSGASVSEGGTATFTVTANPAPVADLEVTLNVADVEHADYLTTSRESATVTIPTSGSVDYEVVTTGGDSETTDEPDGEITVTVNAATGYTVGTNGSATVKVTDDDATEVTLKVENATVGENDSVDTARISLTLNRALRAGESLAIPLMFTGIDNRLIILGSVRGDGVKRSGHTVTFTGSKDGSVESINFGLKILSDDNATDETFTVSIPTTSIGEAPILRTNLSGGATGSRDGNGLIMVTDDDEVGITFNLESVSVMEGGNGSYTVVLDTRPTEAVTVTISGHASTDVTVDTDSAEGNQNTLTFNPTGSAKLWSTPQTVTFTALHDADTANDDVTLTHTASGGDYASVSEDLEVTVTDDDTVVTITGGDAIEEGGNAVFTLTANPAPTRALTVHLNVADDADSDFVAGGERGHEGDRMVAVLMGGAATYYTVPTVNDSGADADESNGKVTVTVVADPADPVTYAVGSTATASVAVRDNDATTVTLARSGGSGAIAEGAAATLTVTLGRALVAGEEITAPLTVSGEGIAAGDYTVALASGASLNREVTLNTSAPHSAATPAVVFAGHGTQTVQVATLTLTAVNDEVDEGVSETLTVGFGSDSRAVTSNLDRASGTGTGGTAATGTVAVEITDNDTAAATLVLTPDEISESGAGNVSTVTATLSHASTVATTLTVSAAAVSPATSSDFTVSSNKVLTIAAGAKASTGVVKITAVDNKVDAANKTVTVSAVASGGHSTANPGNQTLTIEDDDEVGITFSPTSVSVTEEGSGSYTVVLDTQPTAVVMVTIESDSAELTIADTDSVMQGIQNTLTFNPSGLTKLWNAPQTVTVNAGADVDTANDVVTLTHDARGGDYASVEEDLSVTITDNDTPGLSLSPDKLTVEEGSSTNTYTVRLATQPTANVTVAITSDVTGVTVQPASLTFSASTPATLWSTAQEVTVTAAQDDTSTTYDPATLSHTVSGAGSGYGASQNEELVVTVTDTTEPEITIARSGGSGAITEGGTATFTVTATPAPAEGLEVTLTIADVANADYLTTVRESATVMVPVGGTVTHNVVTSADSTDEPDGEITVTVTDGAGYTVGSGSSATVEVNDNDATTVTLTTPDAAATEGSSTQRAQIVLTLGRALRANEILAVPLAFSGGVLGTDFTLALTTAATGVGLNATTGVVTFMGSDDPGSATVATVTLTASHDADAEEDTIMVTIPAAHTGNPRLTATGLSGGATGTVTDTHGTITVSDDDEVGITFSPTSVSVTEEGSGSYTVVLATEPTAVVTVTIASDNTELTIADTDSVMQGIQNTLTFNPTGVTKPWNTPQTVTVNAAADVDTANDAVTLTHTANGGDYASVEEDLSVTITDNDTAGLVIAPSSLTVNEGSNTNTYTVKLATEPTADVTVTIGSDNTDVTIDGPDAGTAFTASETLTFSASGANLWSTAQTVTVSAAQDVDVSDDEATLTHTASNTGGYNGVTGEVAVTVTDDDEPEITIARTSGASVTEGGTATFRVTADPVPAGNLAVTLTIADVANADYLTPSRQSATVTVPTSGSVVHSVVTTADSTDEPDGEITVTVNTGTGYTVGTTDSATVEVNDDDATTVTLTTPDAAATEGSSTQRAQIVLTLGRVLRADEILAVPLAFSGGVLGTDFTLALTTAATGVGLNATTGVVTFMGSDDPGSATVATVTLTAAQDADAEEDTITVTIPAAHTGNPRLTATGLSGGATGTVTDTHGTITVSDDDEVGITFSPTSVSVTEEGSSSYTVVLDTQPTEAVTVTITSDNTELTIADTDSVMQGIQNTLTFNPTGLTKLWNVAQEVTVNAGADVDTANDDVTLTHGASGGDYASVSEDLSVTITDNDTAGLVIAPSSLTVAEGSNTNTYTVRLATEPTANVTVTIGSDNTDVTIDGPDSATAFTASETLTFSPSTPATLWSTAQTVTVSAAQDTDTVDDEATLTHTASNTGGYNGVTGEVDVTVTDDDEPEITIARSGGSGAITEGGTATFTVTADPVPAAALAVTLNIADVANADYLTTVRESATVMVPVGGTVTHNVVTSADSTDEPDGEITVTVTDGAGYTVGSGSSAMVGVNDDDATTVTLTTPDVSATEGDGDETAEITLTLGRALRAGESLAVPLAFTGGTLGTDFTLALTAATGVGLNATTGVVTFTGRDAGSSTTATVMLAASQDADAEDESITVTIPATDSGEGSILTATNLSGGASGSRDGNGVITVSDDDEVGITFNPASVSVTEEGSSSYTVVLDTQPTEAVTVEITSDSAELTIADTDSVMQGIQNTLTFNPTGLTKLWNAPQTVTVNALADVDTANDVVMLTHDASGGDYASVEEDLSVTITDNDTAGLSLSPTSLTVSEGGTNTYTVRLATPPTANVTVAITSDVTGVTVQPTSLVFSPSTSATLWSTAKMVTVTVAQDDTSTTHAAATLSHAVSGAGSGYGASQNEDLVVTVTDTTEPEITIARTSGASVTEGGTATFRVTADPVPAANLAVTLTIADVEHADYLTPARQSATVMVPTGGSVVHSVVTTADTTDEPDGEITVTVNTGTGYTVGTTDSATVEVNDNDATTVTLKTPDTSATEGSSTATARMVLELGRALRAGEVLAVPLGFSGGVLGTDFTLALTTATGVGLNATTGVVTFTGRDAGSSTTATVTLTASHDDDAANDTITVSIPAAHTGNPSLTATNLSGGASGSRVGNGVITVTDDDEVGITFSPTSVSVTEEGSGSYTVVLDTQPTEAVTVTITSDSAELTIADTDGDTPSDQNTLTFNPSGVTKPWNVAQTVTVNAAADVDTANDDVTLTHAASGGDYGSVSEDLEVMVTDDDTAPVASFATATGSYTEKAGAASARTQNIRVNFSAVLPTDITLNYSVTGTATSGADYTALTGTVAVSASATHVEIPIVVTDDMTDEVRETVILTLNNGTGYTVNASSNTHTLTLFDNDATTVTIAAGSDTLATEGDSNDTAQITLTLSRELYAGESLSTPISTTTSSIGAFTLALSGTPAGVTFSSSGSIVTFTGSDTGSARVATLNVTALDDEDADDETFIFRILLASGGLDGGVTHSGTASITLDDDDTRGLTLTSPTVMEGGSGTYTVKLDTKPSASVTVTITGHASTDLTLDTDSGTNGNQNTLTFNPTGAKLWSTAQTVTVTAAEDDDTTNDTVTLNHDVSGGGYTATEDEDLEVTITDNDTAGLVIAPSSLTVNEGSNTSTYTVRLATEPSADVTVTITSDNTDVTIDGPDSATAFTASEELTFSASGSNLWSTAQTVTVSAAQDVDVSDDEATLTHTASDTGGYDDVTADLEVTVTDDDEPEITIARSGGSGAITEGGTATFTVTANPVPAANLAVTLNIADVANADYLAPGNQGTKTVTVPVGGSVDYDVVTTGGNSETTDEPDGEITVTVNAATGYTVSNTNGSATVEVEDDDATTVTLTTPTATATEDSSTATARLVLTLGRALRADEILAVPLGFSGGALNTDFTLALTAATGVGLDATTGVVTFTGSDAGSATVATVTLTASHDADAEDESITVTIPASHTGNAPILTATNLSGGAAGSRVGNGVITVSDDEERGITLSPTSLTVTEGDSGRYTVVLDTQPTGAVTVEISGHAGSDLTVTPTSLTFNSSGSEKLWNVAQEVVVTVSEDDDTVNDSVVTLAHDVSGGGYGSSEDADLEVTITDNDTPGLSLSPDKLTVEEGSSTNTYTVRLATPPTANVTVAIASDVTGVTVQPASLTFSASTPATLWSTAQEVTVTVAQDDTSTTYDSATLSHTVSGAGSGYGTSQNEDLVVTVTDTTEPEITIARSGGSGAITEGGTATFTVTADPAPAANLEVTLNVADVEHADYLASGNQGTQTVTVPTTGSVDYDVVTTGGGSETTDEPDGEITVTVTDGTGYTVGTTGSAKVEVQDDDATPVTLTTPDTSAEEGSSTKTARIVLTLGRALRAGEVLAVPLAFTGGTLGADFTLELTTADGVGLSGSTVTFSGSSGGSSTVATVTLKASQDDNATDETITVTIPAAHTGNPRLTATGLSGGATGTVTANHGTITVSDDDEVGITFSPTSVTVAEEGSSSYTVVLDTQPTEAVTVTIESDSAELTIADTDSVMQGIQNTLTFNPTGLTKLWNVAQEVTVNAGADVDTANDDVTLTHGASGGDYASVSEDLSVTITDNDTAGLVITPTSLTVAEGSSANTYTVRLSTEPSADVTVTIGSDNTDVTIDGPDAGTAFTASETLTFSASGSNLWSTAQTVTVSAAQDVDVSDDEATLTHTASDTGGYDDVTADLEVTVTDDDEPEITIARSGGSGAITEGGTATFTVTADPAPAANLAVTLNVADVEHADYLASGNQGTQTVTVPTSGSVVHSVVTTGGGSETTDEPDGEITVTVTDGAGYTVGSGSSAKVEVEDDDATTVTLTTPTATATEDSSTATARLVLTLGRALRANEILAVPLAFSGGALNTDFTLALTTAATGVGLSGSTVTFMGSDDPGSATVATVTLTASHDADAEEDTITVTIPASHTGNPRLTATGLSGGATGSRDGNGVITVTDDDANDAPSVTLTVPDSTAIEGSSKATARLVLILGRALSAGESLAVPLQFTGGALGTDFTLALSTTPRAGVSLSGHTVTFTGSDFGSATAATVMLMASHDDDAVNESITVSIPASSASGNPRLTAIGFSGDASGSRDGNGVITVTDDDYAGLVFDPTRLSVTEEGNSRYTVVLNTRPTAPVTVTITSGDPSRLTVNDTDSGTPGIQNTFTFHPSGSTQLWNVPQTVTVTAAADEDTVNADVTLSHTASGGDYTGKSENLTVTITDNDVAGLVITSPGLTVEEGSAAAYTVRLAMPPSADVTVTVASNHANVTVDTDSDTAGDQNTLTFSPLTPATLWSAPQTVRVRVNAVADEDTANDDDDTPVTLTHTVTGAGSGYGAGQNKDLDVTVLERARPGEPSTVAMTVPERVKKGDDILIDFQSTPAQEEPFMVWLTLHENGDFLAGLDVDEQGIATRVPVIIPAGAAGARYTLQTYDNEVRTDWTELTVIMNSGEAGGVYQSDPSANRAVVKVTDDRRAAHWWAALGPQARLRAIRGEVLISEAGVIQNQEWYDRNLALLEVGYWELQNYRKIVDHTVASLIGEGGHESVGAWWQTLDCGWRRVAVGAGRGADEASPWCADWPGTAGAERVLDSDRVAEVTRIGLALLGIESVEAVDAQATALRAEVAALTVADARVIEAADAVLEFTVRLNPAVSHEVTVDYTTRDGAATAPADYTAIQGVLRFAAGETEHTLQVAVQDDAHDEGEETLELVLSNAQGAAVARAVATGTIVNTDPMPKAWLGRFGRAVAEQVVEAVSGRMEAARTPGFSGRVGGAALDGAPDEKERAAHAESATQRGALEWHGDWPDSVGRSTDESREMTLHELVMESDFTLTGETDSTDRTRSVWGRMSESSFDGAEEALTVQGEVVTGFIGLDIASDDRWLMGLALSQSEGEGNYTLNQGTGGEIETRLTALTPYGLMRLDEDRSIWGALGFGQGTLTLKPEQDTAARTDIGWQMAAAGMETTLIETPESGGAGLSTRSDLLWTRATSDSAANLEEATADVTRVRVGLAGSYRKNFENGGALTPKFEAGLRRDDGDAETGWGIELGGGLVWQDSVRGLDLSIEGRGLATHTDDAFNDRGYAAAFAFDPTPDSERGLSLSLKHSAGGSSSGGMQTMFSAGAPPKSEDTGDAAARWTAEAAFGRSAFGGRFTGVPYLRHEWSANQADTTLGWRLAPKKDREDAGFSMDVEATRRDNDEGSTHSIGAAFRFRW